MQGRGIPVVLNPDINDGVREEKDSIKLPEYKVNKNSVSMKRLRRKRVCRYCDRKAGLVERWISVCYGKYCRRKYHRENNEKKKVLK